jgi:rRNA maturation endonuclease Nob1
MSLDCFQNLIGIDGKCTADSPESVYNVNDLTGITIHNVESGISSEPDSAVSYLTRIKDVIAPQIITDTLRTHLMTKHQMKSIIDQEVIGLFKDDLETQSAQAFDTGINVVVDKEPYLAFHLTKIGLQLQSSGAVNVRVIDLISGTVLDTISVTTVANVPTYVDLNKTYFTDKQKLNLLIAYDATALGSYETNLAKNFCTSCGIPYKRGNRIQFTGKKIATGSTLINDNLESMDGTAGLSITYSLSCAVEPFICSLRALMATSVLYKVGELVMKEMRGPNNRLNSVVAVYQNDFERLELEFREMYDETIKNIMDNLNIPNDECFNCRSRVRHKVMTP